MIFYQHILHRPYQICLHLLVLNSITIEFRYNEDERTSPFVLSSCSWVKCKRVNVEHGREHRTSNRDKSRFLVSEVLHKIKNG